MDQPVSPLAAITTTGTADLSAPNATVPGSLPDASPFAKATPPIGSIGPYVLVLRYSALGVYAKCCHTYLFDATRFNELSKLAMAFRDCCDSSVVRALAQERGEAARTLYEAARGRVPYSRLALAYVAEENHELVRLPLYALALLPDLIKTIREDRAMHSWAIEHKITNSEVRLGAKVYLQVTMWELAGLLDSNLVATDLAGVLPLFNCVLLPEKHDETLTLLIDSLAAHDTAPPDYATLLLPAKYARAAPVPGLLCYRLSAIAQTAKMALYAIDQRRRAQAGCRVFTYAETTNK